MKRIRWYIFLRDVALLSVTAFGGPQAHLAMFLDVLVKKRGYLNENELIELNALCQILPGPTSTQTITAIGYSRGGAGLAYLTLLVWMLPAVTIMIIAGIFFNYFTDAGAQFKIMKYIQPMAVGIVTYASYTIAEKVVNTKMGVFLMISSGIACYFINTPVLFPVVLLLSGLATAWKYKQQPLEKKGKLVVDWRNFFLWAGVFVLAAVLGAITKWKPLLLFENFYRNGSLIFGGGQVLIPLIYTEFVEFKHYLTSSEFLSGYGLVHAIPGPVFSFSAFIGSLSVRDAGIGGEVLGGITSAVGIFLPGTFLIFFVIKFWDSLKKYRYVRASLEGISAASSGMVGAAAVLMFEPLPNSLDIYLVIIGTIILMRFTKIPTHVLILCGLLAGVIFSQ